MSSLAERLVIISYNRMHYTHSLVTQETASERLKAIRCTEHRARPGQRTYTRHLD